MRLFVAVPLAGPAAEGLGALLGDLAREAPEVRWVQAASIHLTLKFLGETEPARVPSLSEALDEAARRAGGPFEISVAGLGAFGEKRSPRVVWIGTKDPGGRLASLQREIETAGEAAGFPREDRRFRAHLTLARPRSGTAALSEAIRSRSAFEAGSLPVEGFLLMRSTLLPGGARHETIRTFPLAGAGA